VKLPLVSIIIPYYNHGRFLQQAVQSALRAYSGQLEIIIVNDGSRELKAPTYLKQLQDLSPAVHVFEQVNGGLSAARNAGLARAKGDYIQFLDSDDMLVPGKIDLQVEQFRMQPDLGVSVTNYLLSDDTGSFYTRDGDPITRFDFTLSNFLMEWERGFSIPIHCGVFRADALRSVRFDTSVSAKEDWIFWSTLAFNGQRFAYLPVYGAIYRQHPHSMTKSFKSTADSWLRAAQILDEMTGSRQPGMIQAAQEWHRTFYLPRIAKSEREGVESRAVMAGVKNAEGPPQLAPGEFDWIRSAAALREKPTERPLLSVVVPVYNHYGFLRQCLSSLVAQNAEGGVEIVIADDASPDPRVGELLEAFAKTVAGVQLISSTANRGISVSQNAAVEAAKGEYVAFVDCDDFLAEGALARVAADLRNRPDYVFTDRTDVDESGQKIRVAKYGGYPTLKPSGDIAADLLDGMVASHLKVIRRETYLAAGGSDPAVTGVQDWDIALKIAARKGRFHYIPEPLYAHRQHTQSVTSADSARQFWLTNVVRRRHAVPALRPGISDSEAMAAGRAACLALAAGRRVDPGVFVVRNFPSADFVGKLRQAWKKGQLCIYAPKVGAPLHELNLAREFNSYFDGVLAADEATACMLVGFMWSGNALIFAGEALHALA
jgi:O-antigen biosynthesis protein